MLPNCIIVGAPKAGTSSLFRWLTDHPEVAGSTQKETYYFVDPGTHMYLKQRNWAESGLAGYEMLFEHCNPSARVIVESTPSYMYSQTALRELPRLPSQPQFIFILREPVAQLKSLYGYFRENWDWIPGAMSFRDFVEAADLGTCTFKGNELARQALTNASYLEHLRRWRAGCGRERMHVYLFENMVRDKRAFMESLAQVLGISTEFYREYGFPTENGSYVVRSRWVQQVNIRVRSLIPKGAGYETLRRFYRTMNTKPQRNSQMWDSETERMLSRRYVDMIHELEREFGLNASAWRHAIAARLNVSHDFTARAVSATQADLGTFQ
ncbi:sulfotransferase [Mesorhizobium sp. M1406]|uniref:sulfotransferase family protein n=1 Tax=Mesorhizobium sp. M1406 TaxID=2957099 RepID=UPI003336FE11